MDFRFGVELEVGYKRHEYDNLISLMRDEGWNVGGDSSINIRVPGVEPLELKSRVYEDLKSYLKTLKLVLPYLGEANNSMGYHIHISFPNNVGKYISLCSRAFINHFKEQFIHFAQLNNYRFLQERLNNTYCNFDYPEEYFTKNHFRERRKAVNFCAYEEHKTIEFRIFAMQLSLSYLGKCVYFLQDTIHKYMEKNPVLLKDTCIIDVPERNIVIPSRLTREDLAFLGSLRDSGNYYEEGEEIPDDAYRRMRERAERLNEYASAPTPYPEQPVSVTQDLQRRMQELSREYERSTSVSTREHLSQEYHRLEQELRSAQDLERTREAMRAQQINNSPIFYANGSGGAGGNSAMRQFVNNAQGWTVNTFDIQPGQAIPVQGDPAMYQVRLNADGSFTQIENGGVQGV